MRFVNSAKAAITALVLLLALASAGQSAGPADEAAIQKLVSATNEAWNRGDAKAFAERFDKDGSFTNILGLVYYGHDAFEQRHAEIFSTIFKGSTLKLTIRRVHFVRPDVAVLDVDHELTGYLRLPPGAQAGPDGALRTRQQSIVIKEKGEWWMASFHNVDVKPLPPRQ